MCSSDLALEHIWGKPKGPEDPRHPWPDTISLLNRLKVGVGEVLFPGVWANLLVSAVRSSKGWRALSPHYWQFLDKLGASDLPSSEARDVEVAKWIKAA